MKKILSLLVVMSIVMLSFGSVFAAADYTGMKIVAVEDENGLVKTDIYVNHSENIKSITVTFKLNGVKAVDAATKTTPVTATAAVVGSVDNHLGWAVQKTMFNASQKLYSFTFNDTTLTGKVFADEKVATIYFQKDAGANLAEALTTASTGMFASYMMQLQVDASVIYKLSTHSDLFTLDITPYTAPVDPEPETPAVDAEAATEEAIKDLAGDWTSGEFTYPGATPDTTVGKKVATFGKANVILTAENYGVKIGNRFYPGKMDVPAGSYFAIIVVNSDSDAAIEDAYTYSIYTGNANNNPTIIAENLSAVVK